MLVHLFDQTSKELETILNSGVVSASLQTDGAVSPDTNRAHFLDDDFRDWIGGAGTVGEVPPGYSVYNLVEEIDIFENPLARVILVFCGFREFLKEPEGQSGDSCCRIICRWFASAEDHELQDLLKELSGVEIDAIKKLFAIAITCYREDSVPGYRERIVGHAVHSLVRVERLTNQN